MLTPRANKQRKQSDSPTPGFSFPSQATYAVVGVQTPRHPILPPADWAGGFDYRGQIMGTDACDLVVANLSVFLDNELDNEQQQAVRNHLSRCAGCSVIMQAMQENDAMLIREWRDDALLPSSFGLERRVDSIMDALPAVPAPLPEYQPKRIHSRTRWMRFAAGALSVLALWVLSWVSYTVGYVNGRKSLGAVPSGMSSWVDSSTASQLARSGQIGFRAASAAPSSAPPQHLTPAAWHSVRPPMEPQSMATP